ncbi:MAG: TIGR03619 family F420-dependent LLM class oxidoreductase [Acidimicrobiales bacterium]
MATRSRLRFGMQLPVQAQSSLFAEPWEASAGRDELAQVARAADAAGFDYLAVCDHVAIPESHAPSMGTTWYDTIATLGWLAGITERVRLLSHVYVVAYRHPLQTAKAFASLDELSGGRVILGVGAGHLEPEFELLGVPFTERGRRADETIDAIRAAFRDEFGCPGFGQRPRPRQAGGPPIWVGGSSNAAIRRAAERGDGWLPQGTLKKDMPAAIERLRKLRAEAGRDDRPFTIGAIAPSLSGPASKLTAYLRDYAAMGVDQVQVRFPARSCDELCDQIAAFASDVGPELE